MTIIDSTIVNIALPSIRADLGFTEDSLVWVVNAYLLTFGGFLLLGGRLGDLFGYRRLFLFGIMFLTLASLGCGLAGSRRVLVGARAVQGVSGAVVSAVSLSLILNLFTRAPERAKAIGIFGFVGAGAGSMGLLLGGVLTSALNWHWIFFVNLPIGVVICALGFALLPDSRGRASVGRLDIVGAVTVTTSLMLAVYAIVNGNEAGWTSTQTFVRFASAASLLGLFFVVEARAHTPLLPVGLFRLRNLAVANVAGALWAAALFAWLFYSALYLQVVLGFSPLQVGLAFLPANLIMAAFSLCLSARLVIRFGIKLPLAIGLLLAAAGLLLFGRAPVGGGLAVDVLPGMLLFGLGGGMASTPLLLAALSGVAPSESGVASGVVNTTLTMGGAFGLAILTSIAAARTKDLLASGTALPVALNSGYHVAFCIGAGLASASALLSTALLRTKMYSPPIDHDESTATAVVTASDD
jgi:EmrB/QacA subfamily drug resistance transporter